MKQVVLINILGIILIPAFILLKVDPYLVTFFCGIASSYIFLKQNHGYINGIFSWNLGFLTIIGLDGLFYFQIIGERIGVSHADITTILLNYSFFIINIAYVYFYRKKNSHEKRNLRPKKKVFHKQTTTNLYIIIGVYVLLIGYKLPGAIEVFFMGREPVSELEVGGLKSVIGLGSTILSYFVKYSGFILPAIIYHYIYTKTQKSNLWLSLLILLPIFFIQFAAGVRYFLLFSLGTFLMAYIYYNRIRIKRFFLIFGALALVYLGGTFISKVRTEGLSTLFSQDLSLEKTYDRTEHTMQFMTMVVDYYDGRSYEYGTSTASLFLFWIPRTIWEDKPALMGYWFIRAYYGHTYSYGPTYSAPASYMSEAYSDFGPLGVLFLSLLMAYFFVKLDKRLEKKNDMFSLKKLILFFAVPGVFFLPRQINASYVAFIGVGLLVLIYSHFAKRKYALPPEKLVKKPKKSQPPAVLT